MYPETQIPNGGLMLLGAVALSFLMPGWVAAFLGFGAAHAILLAWMTGHEGIPLIVLWLCYGAFGFGMLVGVAIGAYAACIALMRGLAKLRPWAVQAGQAMGALLGELLYWPIQLASELVWDEVQERRARLSALLEEQHELRRVYREDYADQFVSFRAFLRDFRARQKRETHRQESDALTEAIRLMGLHPGFTRAELKQRFRLLIDRIHPDKVGPNELATQLIAAYTLIDKGKAWT
jgi:hypothetical protein